MSSKKLTLAFDLDGVIAVEPARWDQVDLNSPEWGYDQSEVVPGVVEMFWELKKQGHRIVIYTSRKAEDLLVTTGWLKEKGIPYDELFLEKPWADFYFDDKAVCFSKEPLCGRKRFTNASGVGFGRLLDGLVVGEVRACLKQLFPDASKIQVHQSDGVHTYILPKE